MSEGGKACWTFQSAIPSFIVFALIKFYLTNSISSKVSWTWSFSLKEMKANPMFFFKEFDWISLISLSMCFICYKKWSIESICCWLHMNFEPIRVFCRSKPPFLSWFLLNFLAFINFFLNDFRSFMSWVMFPVCLNIWILRMFWGPNLNEKTRLIPLTAVSGLIFLLMPLIMTVCSWINWSITCWSG